MKLITLKQIISRSIFKEYNKLTNCKFGLYLVDIFNKYAALTVIRGTLYNNVNEYIISFYNTFIVLIHSRDSKCTYQLI